MLIRVVKVGNEQPNIEIEQLIKLSYNEILRTVKLKKRRRVLNLISGVGEIPFN